MIEKIQIAKKMFFMEVQLGYEVFIPSELSQDWMPMSFRYYDAILNLVMENVSHDTKSLYAFKNDFRLNFYKEHKSIMNTIIDKLGFSADESKMVSKNLLADQQDTNQINHVMS